MRRALYPAEKKTENRLTNQADSSPFFCMLGMSIS